MSERTCRGCPTVIVRGPRERNQKLWCSEKCRQKWWRVNRPDEHRAIQARAAEKRRAATRARAKPCRNCGDLLARSTATYCSKRECDLVANRARAKAAYDADPAAARAKAARRRATMTPEQREREAQYVRAWKAAAGYTEAQRAADARRRARKRSGVVEKFTHSEVFERDGWCCGICSKKIDRALSYPDPMSVSLDHVVALADGGDHTRANTRASHLRCNIDRKTGRGEVTQLALI